MVVTHSVPDTIPICWHAARSAHVGLVTAAVARGMTLSGHNRNDSIFLVL